VVKPFHLPKDQHTVLPSSLLSSTTGDDGAEIDEAVPERSGVAVSYTHPRDSPLHFAQDVQMGEVSADLPSRRSNAMPKSMRELAEDDLRRQASEIAPSDEPERRSRSTPAARTMRGGRAKALMKSGTNTPSKSHSSVERKNGKKRIREDTDSASEDDHRFDNAASTRDGNSTTGNPTTTPGRVLRPRPQKNAAKLREEAELERAFRRAIAE
jgi:xeroderma pigmentosum group C-complementing protein